MKTVHAALGHMEKQNLETKLMHELLEALKDLKFKELVEQLSLPYETLCKYTSSLEECTEEFHHCHHCKGLLDCKNKIMGYAYLPHLQNENLSFEYQACRYQRKKQKEESHLQYITCIHIPKQVRQANMKSLYMDDENRFDAIKGVTEFMKSYPKVTKGIYLYGSFGGGKTYLISAMLNELAKKKIKSTIIFWPEFLRDLKNVMNERDEFKRKLDSMMKTPILLIDDIGSEIVTAWGRDEIFCPLLQYRMQEELPTFFTSNLDLKALEQHFSMTKDGVECIKARRILERIKQMTIPIEMISQNLRQ